MNAAAQLNELYHLLLTEFSPQQHVIYKPNRNGTGQALKVQLRLEPSWKDTDAGGFFDKQANKEGGLFLEIAPQGPKVGDYPTFLWDEADQVMRAKFGIPDITGLLVAIREYRVCRVDVPEYLQARNDPKPNQVSLFHKFANGSTVITYTFDDTQSILRISKGKDRARSIALSLGEELLFQRYLELALDAYLRVGKR